ncbi:MAG: sensor histidine kinase [Chitinophagaceae bacterium]|nr:sensor histidine kinase [Chitinophagaceae bacterium]
MTKPAKIIFHIIGCLLFLAFPVLLAPHPTLSWEVLANPFVQRDLMSYALGLCFFYTSYYFLIPAYYFKKNYIAYFLFNVLFIFLIAFLPRTLVKIDSHADLQFDKVHHPMYYLFEMKHHLILFFGILFASLALRINDKLKKSHREKLITELSYLKAQINPHFLFNTLNSIYSLAIDKSEHTAKAIVTLSGMMRYAISDTSAKFVSLEKEMAYINNYIELQKLRLGDTAIINYTFDGDISEKQIAPLVLIPFIENAFKHGVNPEETSQIDIQLSVSDINLYLHVFNLKVPHNMQTQLKTGFGLENGRSQLKLLYPNKHSIKIENKNLSFTVSIKINLS